jgi:NADPH-dependent F420 reductase
MTITRVAIVGGTGPQGRGLAERLAMAGYAVVVGSRDPVRAEAVAAAVRTTRADAQVTGAMNVDAVAEADATILAIPAAGLEATLATLKTGLAGRLVIDMVVPLAIRDGVVEHAPPPGAASAGELVQRLLPQSRVVSAFKTIPAAHLARTEQPLTGDVLVCGDDPTARTAVATLVERIASLRAIDAGALGNVRYVEGITALLVSLNRQHHAHTSIRVLGLD